jgi:selenocysteine lyase/cysteine desulfurase
MLNGSASTPGLRRMKNVKVFLDYEDLTKRDLILAIGIENLEHAQAVREYERRGVIVYERVATSLYSKRMLHSFGLEGAVRVSPLHCHSVSDIDKFLQITHEISRAFNSAELGGALPSRDDRLVR